MNGIIINLIRKGMSDAEIAYLVECSTAYVANIREQVAGPLAKPAKPRIKSKPSSPSM